MRFGWMAAAAACVMTVPAAAQTTITGEYPSDADPEFALADGGSVLIIDNATFSRADLFLRYSGGYSQYNAAGELQVSDNFNFDLNATLNLGQVEIVTAAGDLAEVFLEDAALAWGRLDGDTLRIFNNDTPLSGRRDIPGGYYTYSFFLLPFSNVTVFTNPTPDGENYTYAYTFGLETAAVPEPASWGLMIGGMGFAGAALRTRSWKVALA